MMPGIEGPEGELHSHDYRLEVVVRDTELDDRGMSLQVWSDVNGPMIGWRDPNQLAVDLVKGIGRALDSFQEFYARPIPHL
jgi:hypothetical protein